MGVPGLWSVLQPYRTNVSVDQMKHDILSIDISIWIKKL